MDRWANPDTLIRLYIEESEKVRHQDKLLFQTRFTAPVVVFSLITIAITTRADVLLPIASVAALVFVMIDIRHSTFCDLFVRRANVFESLINRRIASLFEDSPVGPYKLVIEKPLLQKVTGLLIVSVLYTILIILPIVLYMLIQSPWSVIVLVT